MDNEEDLLDEKHFNDGNYEFDDLDADAENKLLGLSDDEGNNFEYEYVDEEGKSVVLDESNQTEYEVVQNEEKNLNAEDVLDLEIDHDLEFDESAVSESFNNEPTIKKEIVNEERQQNKHEEYNSGQMSDSSESDDENAGRGRFRSERPNIVQLSTRHKRNNIPDSLEDVFREEMRSGNYHNQRQFKGGEHAYNQRQYEQRDRFNHQQQREYTNNKDRSPSKLQQQNNSQNYSAGNSNDPGMTNNSKNWSQPEQNFQANVSSSTENQATAGPRKILINPHFKGSLPVNNAPPTNLWNAGQNQMNYNEAYGQTVPQQQQQQPLLPGSSYNNQLGYGGQDQGQQLSSNTPGLLPVPNQINMVPQMRQQMPVNSGPNEALKSNEFQWNRMNNNSNYQTHPLLPSSNLLPPTSTVLMEQQQQTMPPLMFPPPIHERPPPPLQGNQFYDNRQFQMRPMHSPNNPQWNSTPSNSNFDQFSNAHDGNVWRTAQQPPNNQQQPLLSSPTLMGKFPDVRQPPPNLHMQQQHHQAPRPVMNFNSPPPNFTNIRPNVSNSNWSARASLLNPSINNYQQIPPTPLMSKKNTNVGVPVPLRLPLPNLNMHSVNRFNHPKSLLGNPVLMPTVRQMNNFSPRPSHNFVNVRKDGPKWNQNNSGMQPQMQFRKRGLEEQTGSVLKHQKTTFINKQGNLVRRKPVVVNANIKEVKIVENISTVENLMTKPIVKVDEDEDEETKIYRAQIELQNKKRAEILRIKEERREMMAIQRRKLMLKQQLLNSETDPDSTLDVTQLQTSHLPGESPLVLIPPSPMTIKKRVMIRRVQTSPGLPRKPVTTLTKIGMAQVQVGVGSVNVAVSSANVGAIPVKVGLAQAKVGVAPVKVGLAQAKIGGPPVKVGTALVTAQTKVNPLKQLTQTVPTVKKALLPSPSTNINVNKTATILGANQEVKRQVQVRQLRAVQLVNKNEQAVEEKVRLQINNVVDPAVRKINRIMIQTGRNEVGSVPQIANQRPRVGILDAPTSVLIENLSLATTEAGLKQLCQFYGDVQKVEMRSDNRTAVVKFKEAASAQTFVDRCQRRMVDLSLIAVSLVSP